MRKLIHSKFELDLSQFKLSDTEENNWFSDSFFAKYSFPFEIDLTAEWDVAFDFISFYNTNPETYYEVKYFDNNKIEDAVFVIESAKEKLSCVLRFGLEQFLNWDTKLAELPLDNFTLPTGTTIYQHAETVISKKWPEVNYNFPQIHIDYDSNDEFWSGFEGILNNRKSGNFLTNSVDFDSVGDYNFDTATAVNRNIMQPLPSLIYVLQQGFAQAGCTLSGNLIEDELLKKALLYTRSDYFTRKPFQEDLELLQENKDALRYDTLSTGEQMGFHEYRTKLKTKGRYKISNAVSIDRPSVSGLVYFRIKYRGSVIYDQPIYSNSRNSYTKFIDFQFTTNSDELEDEFIIESYQKKVYSDTSLIWYLFVELQELDTTVGSLPNSIVNENKVDLTRAVPDITFGDLIGVLKNWFNYDLTIDGKTAIMNKIENEINYKEALDFQFTEVKYPFIKYNQGVSFLLKFKDSDNENYTFKAVYQDIKGYLNTGYKTDENTKTIEIDGFPLPLKSANGTNTAYAFEKNESKVYLVPYSGLKNNNNVTEDVENYLIPSVHLNYFKKWFDFRILSRGFNWSFTAFSESIYKLKTKTKIFAYKRFHIIKTINRTEIKPNLFEIDLETDTLP